MKLLMVTIVKNGMPWIACHYGEMRRLRIPWEWWVMEGTALPENCTSWVNALPPGLSDDGTTEYLDSLKCDSRVFVRRSEAWHGKIAMVNEPLRWLKEPCILMQIDSDELWKTDQLERIYAMLSTAKANCALFTCRYFLGRDIAILGKGLFGNKPEEWARAWRIDPHMRFASHEPPRIANFDSIQIPKLETESMGLIFDHMSFATEEQMKFKANYYGSPQNPAGASYKIAVEGWKRLQKCHSWPVEARQFLPFIDDKALATKVTL